MNRKSLFFKLVILKIITGTLILISLNYVRNNVVAVYCIKNLLRIEPGYYYYEDTVDRDLKTVAYITYVINSYS